VLKIIPAPHHNTLFLSPRAQKKRPDPFRVRPVCASVGQVVEGDFWSIPVDETLVVVVVPGLDVVDGVALFDKIGIDRESVEVGNDGAVV
jgi:hypothetical protein